jgi:YVTN family beta-propeller protein
MRLNLSAILASAALAACSAAYTFASSAVTIPVGTVPKFVAVNQDTNFIYVSNLNSNNVSVIDGATNSVVATVPVGTAPEVLDVNTTTDMVYVANLESNNVSVIDGSSNAVVATIPLGSNSSPFGVALDSTRNLVYVTNTGAGTVSIINGATNAVVATVPVGNTPAGVRVNTTANLIYVANLGSASVSVIDGSTDSVTSTFPLPQAAEPLIVAMDPILSRLFITDSFAKAIYVLNASTGELLQTITGGGRISFKSPEYVALLQPGKSVMVSDSSLGAVIEFNDSTYAFTGGLAAAGSPIGVAVNRTTGKIYVAESSAGTVNVYSQAVAAPAHAAVSSKARKSGTAKP